MIQLTRACITLTDGVTRLPGQIVANLSPREEQILIAEGKAVPYTGAVAEVPPADASKKQYPLLVPAESSEPSATDTNTSPGQDVPQTATASTDALTTPENDTVPVIEPDPPAETPTADLPSGE